MLASDTKRLLFSLLLSALLFGVLFFTVPAAESVQKPQESVISLSALPETPPAAVPEAMEEMAEEIPEELREEVIPEELTEEIPVEKTEEIPEDTLEDNPFEEPAETLLEAPPEALPAEKPPEAPHKSDPVKEEPAPAAVDDEYLQWHSLVLQRIGRNKVYPSGARRRNQEGVVHIAVAIDHRGRLTELVLMEGSGFDLLDEAALRAVRRAASFPAPPSGSATIDFYMDFRLES